MFDSTEMRFTMSKNPHDEITKLAVGDTRADSLAQLAEDVCSDLVDAPNDTLLDPSKGQAFCETELGPTEAPLVASAELPALTRALTNVQTRGELQPLPFPETGCVVAFKDGTVKRVEMAYIEIVTTDGEEMTLSALLENAVGFFRPPTAQDAQLVWDSPDRDDDTR